MLFHPRSDGGIQLDRAEHMGIAVKQPLPGVITDYRRRLVFPIEPTAQQRSRTQHSGVVS
jgi:hypothetical protein